MSSGSGEIPWEIGLIDTPEDIPAVEALQRAVWSGSDLEVVPGHVLLTAAHNGGLVAGAWVKPDRRLAGVVFGFLGLHGPTRRMKHCSHMLGVHPDYRSSGIGAALKAYQCEFVLRQGLDLITWTYDPLLARNAWLNIARLGAVCNTYLVNLYGDLADDLNIGLPTDRLQADWWIASPRVAERLHGGIERPRHAVYLAAGARSLNPSAGTGQPEPPSAPAQDAPLPVTLLLEIPLDFQALRATDRPLALRWRLGVRDTLRALFSRGYAINDFIYEPGPTPKAAYVLTPARLP